MSVREPVRLTAETLQMLQSDLGRDRAVERCGLIGARGAVGVSVYPVANISPTPATRFEMDPRSQVAAMAQMDAQGEVLYAIYHSHPQGPPRPSATDVAEARYPALGFLIGVPCDEGVAVAAFRLGEGGFWEVPLAVSRGAGSAGSASD